MNDRNNNTCPVCFTKMRNNNKVLTCPECGYKYCDHNRERKDMFDTSHTHEANYTTPVNNTVNSSNTTSNTHSSQNLAKIIIIIFMILFFCPIICGVLGTIVTTFGFLSLSEEIDDYEGHEITVTVAPETESIVDIEALLAGVENSDFPSAANTESAPNSIEYTDAEFVTELIKEIFDVADCNDVSAEDLNSIYKLEILNFSSDGLYANYYFNDGRCGSFNSDFTQIRKTNLNAFACLEVLDTPDMTYSEGDLKDLKSLKELACKDTPVRLVNVISSPTQLTQLHLNLPHVSDTLEGLQYFSELETLEISAQNSSVSDAGRIADLPQLTTLSYTDAGELRDFSFLSELTTLNHLTLNAPSLSDLSFLYDMPQLQSLAFYGSDITDLQPITGVKSTLTTLDISFNTFITDYSPLTELSNLKYLYMDYCELTNLTPLSELKGLTELSIKSNRITSLKPLKDLPNLTYIHTYNNPIADYAGLQDICDE